MEFWAGRMAQMVAYLPSKHKTLTSYPSTTKTKQTNKKRKQKKFRNRILTQAITWKSPEEIRLGE
jgi:hypothetical protein